MKTAAKVVLGMLATLGVLFILMVIVSLTYNPEPTTPKPTTQEEAFMEACDDGSSGSRAYCECALDKIYEDNGQDVWEDLGGLSDRELLEWLMPYVEQCNYHLTRQIR